MTTFSTPADRARAAVLRYAVNAEEAAELLDMLGLGEGQDVPVPRTCSGHAARRLGAVHALSAGTEARLATTTDATPTPMATMAPVVPALAPVPTPAEVPVETPVRAGAEVRRCEGCGKPVVPQTRYRLDPAGYRARGILLLAAKGRCHSCYNRLRRPADANVAAPKNPRRKAESAPAESAQQCAEDVPVAPAVSDDEVGRWALALVQANRELAEARAELALLSAAKGAGAAETDAAAADVDELRADRDRLAGLLEEATARIDEMQRQVEHVIATADRLVAATAEQDEHVHQYPWPNQRGKPRPCECGQPWPAGRPPLSDQAKLRHLRKAHAAFIRGDRDEWVVEGERAYQRDKKRLQRWRNRGAVETQRRQAG